MPEVLIGHGKTAKVYKIDVSPRGLARKEFSPIHHVKLWNRFFYSSPHPLTTEAGHKYAYWKRRLAHRLCKYLNSDVHIPDALQFSHKGFTLKYIEGRPPARSDKRALYRVVKRLEHFFDYIGMPTWSFSRRNPFSHSNFILKNDKIYVVDYEQSVPVPDSKGKIEYDAVYFDDTRTFITDNKQRILDRLGEREMRRLTEALELTKGHYTKLDIRPRIITRFINTGKK